MVSHPLLRSAVLAMSGLASFGHGSPTHETLSQRATTFTNPVIYKDLPDIDVFRVGDVFYYSSSTFAYSPGAPVHKSYDLVNWTPVSHSVPRLDFGNKYNLNGNERAYVKGIWASSLRYRKSNDKFYWAGCVEGKTYIYTSPGGNAEKNNGETNAWAWSQASIINKCYYDCGLFFDDDDTPYVVYGNTQISVSQLSADGLKEVKSQQVFSSSTTLEGSHMYKAKGYYWIIPTKPASGEWMLRSKSPFGPYEAKVMFDGLQGPLPNNGNPHQGGWVDTKDGKFWYLAFVDGYPCGRFAVLAPMTWTSDNWPQVTLDANKRWGQSYPMPVQTTKTVPPQTYTDTFNSTRLGEEWEWNHNPDTSKFKIQPGEGLVLSTATTTDDFYGARNTLTHRTLGPKSYATFELDISKMADGDRAGAALFRDTGAYIGIHKSGSNANLVFYNGFSLSNSNNWATASKGSVASTGPALTGSKVWLKVTADVTPAFGQQPNRQAQFSYSTDGTSFKQLGTFTLQNTWQYFTGYRFGLFNFATKSLGGSITLKSFSTYLV